MRLVPARPIDHLVLAIATLLVVPMELFQRLPGWLGPALGVLLALQALYFLWLARRGRKDQGDRGTRPLDRFIEAGLALAAAVVLFLHHGERFAVGVGFILTAAGLWHLLRGVRGLALPKGLHSEPPST
jgi:hypothetical protein